MKRFLLTLALCLLPTLASAQCNGVFHAQTACGTVAGGIPGEIPFNVFGGPGGSSGQVQTNNGSGGFAGITNTQLTALLNTFTSVLSGAVPASGGGVPNFLGADGTFKNPTSTVTYTPLGTGGVATTVKAILDRTIWANDYGAVCDNSTDDHVAFQNAINRGQGTTVPVRWEGLCAVNAALSITSFLDFGGGSMFSQLTATNIAVDVIDISVQSAPVYLHDFYIAYTAPANNGTAAISVSAPAGENSGSKFQRLNIGANAGYGINLIKASTTEILDSTILAQFIDIFINNLNVADSGDSTISGNMLQVLAGGTAIQWGSSGGQRIVNNKILAGGAGLAFGISIILNPGASTADIFIANNSIEGINSTTGSAIAFQRAGATGGLGVVAITGNELSGAFCVNIPHDANGVWLLAVTVTGNICALGTGAAIGATAFIADDVNGLTIIGNTVQPLSSGTNQMFNIGPNGSIASNCLVGLNTRENTGQPIAASILNSCVINDPNAQGTTVQLPTAGNGSQMYATDATAGSSPCSAAGTGAMAFRQNGAWKCF